MKAQTPKMISPIQLMREVCREFGITQGELTGRSRKSHLVKARKEFAKRMLESSMSISDIAFYLQRKHHNITHYFKSLNADGK